jgi:hypothetical protein
MPKLTKSSPAMVARFDEVAARHPAGQRRQMFGYPALFVGGNFATGLFEESWVVRLAPGDAAELFAMPGGRPFEPMAGRAMKGWGLLPPDVVEDDERLDAWVERAFAFAGSLPAKA